MKIEIFCCSLHAGTQSRKWLYWVPSPALSPGALLSPAVASISKPQSHRESGRLHGVQDQDWRVRSQRVPGCSASGTGDGFAKWFVLDC